MLTFTFTCPYCGNKQHRNLKADFYSTVLLFCDGDEGGCNEYFVARIIVKYEITNYKLKETDNV